MNSISYQVAQFKQSLTPQQKTALARIVARVTKALNFLPAVQAGASSSPGSLPAVQRSLPAVQRSLPAVQNGSLPAVQNNVVPAKNLLPAVQRELRTLYPSLGLPEQDFLQSFIVYDISANSNGGGASNASNSSRLAEILGQKSNVASMMASIVAQTA